MQMEISTAAIAAALMIEGAQVAGFESPPMAEAYDTEINAFAFPTKPTSTLVWRRQTRSF